MRTRCLHAYAVGSTTRLELQNLKTQILHRTICSCSTQEIERERPLTFRVDVNRSVWKGERKVSRLTPWNISTCVQRRGRETMASRSLYLSRPLLFKHAFFRRPRHCNLNSSGKRLLNSFPACMERQRFPQ